MQSPRKVKHRKQMKRVRHILRKTCRGTKLSFGKYGLMAIEPAWASNRVIEAGRTALARNTKRGGKIWIKVFCDKPLTKKPAEVRMGKGKGSQESWVAEVQAGRIIYELTGVDEKTARDACTLAASKMPFRCKFVKLTDTIL